MGSEYTLRRIWRTAGGIHRYEIGADKFQVVGVSSAKSLLCCLVENAAPRVNSGTNYRIVGPDSMLPSSPLQVILAAVTDSLLTITSS